MKNKVALIVLYFGKEPNTFKLWLKSAMMNVDFDFHLYTDMPLKIDCNTNVFIHSIKFTEVINLFKNKLGDDINLHKPYKLCDYKPTYGYVFEEDLRNYDFWGFCDIDLVFGQITHFINDDILDQYDKIFYHGHFSLLRNNERMKHLFEMCYPNVMNYRYAFHTRHSCYFDENGSIAYAFENEDIRFFYLGEVFLSPSWHKYRFMNVENGLEYWCKWANGSLFTENQNGEKKK